MSLAYEVVHGADVNGEPSVIVWGEIGDGCTDGVELSESDLTHLLWALRGEVDE